MTRKTARIEQIVADAARAGARTHVRVGNGTPVAELWLDGGVLVAATCEGGEARLGARLVSTGHLARTELERAADAARRRGGSLASTLTASVRRDVLATLARDEARYALAAALAAPDKDVAVADGDPPDGAFTVALDAADLLTETHEFLAAVREAYEVAPPEARPIALESPPPDLALGPDEWAILSRADGAATIARLADECGFPQPEASLIVQRLARMGLLQVEASLSDAGDLMAELAAAEDLAAISAAFEHAVPHEPAAEETPVVELPPLLTDEVAEPELVEASPAIHVDEAKPGRVDTQALLRELASIARQPAGGRSR